MGKLASTRKLKVKQHLLRKLIPEGEDASCSRWGVPAIWTLRSRPSARGEDAAREEEWDGARALGTGQVWRAQGAVWRSRALLGSW